MVCTLLTLRSPVANRLCQKSAIFSCRGLVVVIIRYIQLATATSTTRSSDWSTWYRLMMSSGIYETVDVSRRASTVFS